MSGITLPAPLIYRNSPSSSRTCLLRASHVDLAETLDGISPCSSSYPTPYQSPCPSPPPYTRRASHDHIHDAHPAAKEDDHKDLQRTSFSASTDHYDLQPLHGAKLTEAIGPWTYFRRIAFRNPFQDIPYVLALLSVTGSLVWIVEGVLLLLPIVRGVSLTPDEQAIATGVVAFIGTSISLVANLLLLLETISQLQGQRYGWRFVKLRAMQSNERALFLLERAACPYHPALKENFIAPPDHVEYEEPLDPEENMRTRFLPWLPTFTEVRNHYMHQTGFIACLLQLLAAFCYCAANIANLPGLHERITDHNIQLVFSGLRIIGGAGFTVAGLLYTREAQRNWLKPEPGTLGWQIGLFSIIGGAGFLTSTSLGMQTSVWAVYVSALMTLWGSAAFFLAGIVQLYESLDKYPLIASNISLESGICQKP